MTARWSEDMRITELRSIYGLIERALGVEIRVDLEFHPCAIYDRLTRQLLWSDTLEPTEEAIQAMMAQMPGADGNMTSNEERLRRVLAIEYLKREAGQE